MQSNVLMEKKQPMKIVTFAQKENVKNATVHEWF